MTHSRPNCQIFGGPPFLGADVKVTSTSFERGVENCVIVKPGYFRDSRGDRPQVCIGLVATEEGVTLPGAVLRAT